MRILAVASGGGHWVELLRLQPLFNEHETVYTTVNASYQSDVPESRLFVVEDATSWTFWSNVVLAAQSLIICLRVRPAAVITTGAAPGFFALLCGKLVGARTIWIDSIANVEELSRSGRMAKSVADLWLTQWDHLANEEGPEYAGKVL